MNFTDSGNTFIFKQTRNTTSVFLGIYSKFSNGTTRYRATRRYIGTINGLVKKLKPVCTGSTKQKLSRVHDVILKNCKYDDEAAEATKNGNADEYCSQSAYNIVTTKKGICVGFAGFYQIVCTKLGLTVVQVLSSTHCWNKALVNGNWYNIDLTFDEGTTDRKKNSISHLFFMLDDNDFNRVDAEYGTTLEHTPTMEWLSVGV